MGGPAEFLALVAQRLAGCGAVAPALAALAQLPDPALRQRILQNTIDAAIAQGAAGKTPLPPELHAPFDLIVQAFADCEAGRDEQSRTRLQGIGLQSPFLEWKVLLRGLLAFYAKDDVRALENWQRLDPARLPSRLCAPMRAGIDAAFLASQPPAVQQVLRQNDAAAGNPPRALERSPRSAQQRKTRPGISQGRANRPGFAPRLPGSVVALLPVPLLGNHRPRRSRRRRTISPSLRLPRRRSAREPTSGAGAWRRGHVARSPQGLARVHRRYREESRPLARRIGPARPGHHLDPHGGERRASAQTQSIRQSVLRSVRITVRPS